MAHAAISRTTSHKRMIIETKYANDRGHMNDADQLFRLYLNSYPDDTPMRVNRANLLRKSGRQQEAKKTERLNYRHANPLTRGLLEQTGHGAVGRSTGQTRRGCCISTLWNEKKRQPKTPN
jgi:hypothetical protein